MILLSMYIVTLHRRRTIHNQSSVDGTTNQDETVTGINYSNPIIIMSFVNTNLHIEAINSI